MYYYYFGRGKSNLYLKNHKTKARSICVCLKYVNPFDSGEKSF